MSTWDQSIFYITSTASQVSSSPTMFNFCFITQLKQINRCQVFQCFLKFKLEARYNFSRINYITFSRSHFIFLLNEKKHMLCYGIPPMMETWKLERLMVYWTIHHLSMFAWVQSRPRIPDLDYLPGNSKLYKMDYSVSENFGSNIYIHPEFNISQTRFHSCHFLHSKLKFYPNLD